ncbi:hypothetical protein ACFQ1S_28210, partial [Kibdelosporangium lantanae]
MDALSVVVLAPWATMGKSLRRLAALTLAGVLLASTAASATTYRADWPTWQGDLAGSRANMAEFRINPANV